MARGWGSARRKRNKLSYSCFGEPVPIPKSGGCMASVGVDGFVHALLNNRLLEPEHEGEVIALQSRLGDPRLLAQELIRRGWLTPYQVNQLFLGRGSDLVLGQYILLERLGEGGMGQVFKASQGKLKRTVAFKIIRKEFLNNPRAVRVFCGKFRLRASCPIPISSAHSMPVRWTAPTTSQWICLTASTWTALSSNPGRYEWTRRATSLPRQLSACSTHTNTAWSTATSSPPICSCPERRPARAILCVVAMACWPGPAPEAHPGASSRFSTSGWHARAIPWTSIPITSRSLVA